LQVGDPEAEVNRVLVALTPLPEVFEEAEEKGADFLLFHHPLIFDPLKAVVTSSYPGGLLARLSVTVSQSTRHTRATMQPPQACPSPWQGH
jgi:putative NIF3 family GTP cyclohydrolase 1 type 2